ncbi:hypothetical protein BPA01_41360 [Brevibacillus parabrevis]|uniref:Uncharacterized protein n=1 Tax=Brevibacillus parabrevis TaxID=54914 RepID=A0A4Y3PRH7_BREPA|nr:hypothetical protein BPA01_41360 [Brevibacillus parabrevis]
MRPLDDRTPTPLGREKAARGRPKKTNKKAQNPNHSFPTFCQFCHTKKGASPGRKIDFGDTPSVVA